MLNTRRRLITLLLLLPIAASALFAEPATTEAPSTTDFQIEEGFESLFNGRDLTGWGVRPTTERQKKQAARWKKNDPNAPPWPVFTEAKSFEGKTSTDDGRYIVQDGNLVVTEPAGGRRIQQFYTTRAFPNDFVLRLQFRAAHNADSGVFLRDKQLQCRDYPTAGPYKDLQHFKAQDWNDLEIKVTGNTAHCTCNGEVIEAEFEINENGPIGLEGDRGKMEYRRIRIKTTQTPDANQSGSIERGASPMVIKLSGVTSTEGTVQVAVYSSAKNFLNVEKADHVATASASEAKDGTVTIRLDDFVLPEGKTKVAVTAFHDVNGNDEFDKNGFGAPKEPYGCSNGARRPFGPPKYQQAVMAIPSGADAISITLK